MRRVEKAAQPFAAIVRPGGAVKGEPPEIFREEMFCGESADLIVICAHRGYAGTRQMRGKIDHWDGAASGRFWIL